MKTERNYGIELLRLCLMFMVCLLHVLGQGGILEASKISEEGGVQNILAYRNILLLCS